MEWLGGMPNVTIAPDKLPRLVELARESQLGVLDYLTPIPDDAIMYITNMVYIHIYI